MNRTHRAAMAKETVNILERGTYTTASGQNVDISEELAVANAHTRLYRPGETPTLAPGRHAQTNIRVINATTLAAGRELAQYGKRVCCLNFASAKNPGGGFLGGSQAQEESLARSSGLYAAVRTQPAFYDYHRHERSLLYSDHLIYSPGVPVFRDDDGALLDKPWLTDFITSAAPNAGAIRQNQPEHVAKIPATLRQRAEAVLTVAAAHGCAALVLGAWGCGVFRNAPSVVAQSFADVLAIPALQGQFAEIVFAIYDPKPPHSTLNAFDRVFGGCAEN